MAASATTTRKNVNVDPYAVGWGVIGAVGIGYEIILALTGNRHHTLTAYLRMALGLEPRQKWATAGITAIAVGAAWSGVHVGLNILPAGTASPE
jgi:hypothetical protein